MAPRIRAPVESNLLKATSVHRIHEAEALVLDHQGAVRGYLVVAGCPPDRVEDLCQDVFLSMLSSGFVQRSPSETRGFLRKVARHLLIKMLERENRVWTVSDATELERAERVWEDVEERGEGRDYMEALRHCLAVVRGRAGKVLDRRYRAGHALLKIAEELGLRESGVKSILVRTRRKLRTCIESRLHA